MFATVRSSSSTIDFEKTRFPKTLSRRSRGNITTFSLHKTSHARRSRVTSKRHVVPLAKGPSSLLTPKKNFFLAVSPLLASSSQRRGGEGPGGEEERGWGSGTRRRRSHTNVRENLLYVPGTKKGLQRRYEGKENLPTERR